MRIISTFFPSTFLSLHILFSSPHLIIFCLPLFPDRCPTLQLFISSNLHTSLSPYLISISPFYQMSIVAISSHGHMNMACCEWKCKKTLSVWCRNCNRGIQLPLPWYAGYPTFSFTYIFVKILSEVLEKYSKKRRNPDFRDWEELRILALCSAANKALNTLYCHVCHFPRNIHICDEDERFNISICFARKIWESSIVKVLIGERLLKFEA